MNDDLMNETLTLRAALTDLVSHLFPGGARVSELSAAEMLDAIDGFGQRAGALVYVHQLADTPGDGQQIVAELKDWLRAGHVPRSMSDVLPPREAARARRGIFRLVRGGRR